jgi:hypothetical protein
MSTDQVKDFDLSRCAICGEPNQCAVATDPDATECWCESAIFPHNLLERVPQEAVGRVCVCQRCIENHNKKNDE